MKLENTTKIIELVSYSIFRNTKKTPYTSLSYAFKYEKKYIGQHYSTCSHAYLFAMHKRFAHAFSIAS